MKARKPILLLVVATLVSSFFTFDLGQYFTLEFFKSQREALDGYFQAHPWQTTVVYVAVPGLSLPSAAVMTLVGGAIFGVLWGTLVVSFASTIGATLAFLVSRFLLRDYVQTRFGGSLKAVTEGVRKDGAFYLFTLRLVPLFPFFVINLVMGLNPIRIGTYLMSARSARSRAPSWQRSSR